MKHPYQLWCSVHLEELNEKSECTYKFEIRKGEGVRLISTGYYGRERILNKVGIPWSQMDTLLVTLLNYLYREKEGK